MLASVRRWSGWLPAIGVAPDDTDDVRLQKVTLALSAVVVTGLAVIWVGTYLVLDRP